MRTETVSGVALLRVGHELVCVKLVVSNALSPEAAAEALMQLGFIGDPSATTRDAPPEGPQ